MGAWVASAQASHESNYTDTANTNSFRSAFLGPDAWEDDLSSAEIKQQLQNHFAHVIQRLESTHASSLLRALIRAEATAGQRWTQSQRREALVLLVTNRRRQIARLRYYMNRGLFPQNEGQSASAVPIFVDRHQTHCAVGFLMHSDGRDQAIASIVQKNNFVYVNDVHSGGLIDWIRMSGLTKEEAALIQPAYEISRITTFEDFSTPNATLAENGFVISQATYRTHSFNVTLPVSFQSDPDALQAIFDLGETGIQASNFEATPLVGVILQSQLQYIDQFDIFDGANYIFDPQNLDETLYIGSTSLIRTVLNTSSNQAALVEIEYLLRSEQNDLSQIEMYGGPSFRGEQSAGMILTQIYDGVTNELLGEAKLSASGQADGASTWLSGTDSVQLASDFVRIKTQTLTVGDGSFSRFYHDFKVSPNVLVGDMNGDGAISFLDVQPMIEALRDPVAYQTRYNLDPNASGDADGNGRLTFYDLIGFVVLLGL